MNKVTKMTMGVAVLISALFSCGTDSLNEGSGQQHEVAKAHQVVFTIGGSAGALSTRAVAKTDTLRVRALDREKAVRDLYAVVFSGDQYYKTFFANRVDSFGTYSYDMLLPGDYTMYLVANPNDDLREKLVAGVTTPDSLGRLLVNQNPGNDNTSTDFLMTSAPVAVTTTAYQSTTISDPIKLIRAVARFDIYNRVPLLRMNQITLNNRYIQSKLTTQTSMDAALVKENKVYRVVPDSTGRDYIASIYAYEDVETGNTSITLGGTYNNVNVKPHTITLDGIKVTRNFLYSIVLNVPGDTIIPTTDDLLGKLKYEIHVNDWNEGATFTVDSMLLFNTDAPHFMVQRSYINSSYRSKVYSYPRQTRNLKGTFEADYNPEIIYVDNFDECDIPIKVMTTSTQAKLIAKDLLPQGYRIDSIATGDTITTPTSASNVVGLMTQHFNIHLGKKELDKDPQPLHFVLYNAFKTTSKREFIIYRRKRLPLEQFAEYNLNQAKNGFVSSNACDESAYFAYNNVYSSSWYYHINGKSYHLPNMYEWCSILPYNYSNSLNFAGSTYSYNRSDDCLYIPKVNTYSYSTSNGVTSTHTWQRSDANNRYTYYYYNPVSSTDPNYGKRIVYAIRCRDYSEYRCAYRYEYTNNIFGGGNSYYQAKMLKITCRYLGPTQTSIDYTHIANENFWNNNNGEDIIRYFPYCGYKNNNGDYNLTYPTAKESTSYLSSCGSVGHYWMADQRTSNSTFYVIMNSSGTNNVNGNVYVYAGNGWYGYNALPVRLIENE